MSKSLHLFVLTITRPSFNHCVPSLSLSQLQETPDQSAKAPGSPMSEPDFGGQDHGDIDFDVDTSGQPKDVSGLGLSVDSKDDESLEHRRHSDLGSLEISGLDEEEGSEGQKKRKGKETGPKRMKKRRKIIIDNNMTELSGEHMKSMLRDTSDIIMQNRFNIADMPEEEEEEEDYTMGKINRLLETVPMERLLARPCLGDDGDLAPELLALWGRNTVKSEFFVSRFAA